MTLDARLLIVEDDQAQRELLAGFFRELGADVLEAGDGAEALGMLEQQAPDVVVTDMRMPGIDGAELMRRVRELNPEIGTIVP